MNKEQPILVWLLLTLFIGLKITEQIDWAWIWVLSPAWLFIGINAGIAFVIGFYRGFSKRTNNRGKYTSKP